MLLTACRIILYRIDFHASNQEQKAFSPLETKLLFFTGILENYFYCFVSTNGRFGWLRTMNSRFCFTSPNCVTLLCSIDKKDSTQHIEQSTFKLNDFELSSLLPRRTTYDFPLHTVKFRKLAPELIFLRYIFVFFSISQITCAVFFFMICCFVSVWNHTKGAQH